MRILHSSDWHLGRLFHQVHLTDDQAHVLDQFVELARDLEPDAIIIAGDLYDRAIPPPEAVELLDDVLARLVLDVGIPTIAIAGNHDSAERIGFAGRLLSSRGLHLSGPLRHVQPITLEDEFGPVDIVPLPYAPPEVVRSELARAREGDESDSPVRGHEAALRAQIEVAAADLAVGRRRVAVAHAFVTGATESESERALSVGGTGSVSASVFEGFHYTALGHLHRPQNLAGVDSGVVRYSGSLLPYSFSEVDHERGTDHRKSVSLIELDAAGEVSITEHHLGPRRGMRIVRGELEQLLKDGGGEPWREDYLLVRLDDTRPVLDAMSRLRDVFPNVLHIERPRLGDSSGGGVAPQDHRRMRPIDLFADFFEAVTSRALTDDERTTVGLVILEEQRDTGDLVTHPTQASLPGFDEPNGGEER